MGFSKMVTATCDGPFHGEKDELYCDGSGHDRPEAIQQAKMHGWKWRGQKIMCPKCVESFDQLRREIAFEKKAAETEVPS